jgi:hypothetical protein
MAEHEDLDAAAGLPAEYARDLLRKRGIETLSCPACGDADAWTGYFDAGIWILRGRDPSTGEIEGLSGSAHAVGMTCGTCGYMCFFDRGVIGD